MDVHTGGGGSSADGGPVIPADGDGALADLKAGETLLAVKDVRFAYAMTKKMADEGTDSPAETGPEVLKGMSLDIAQVRATLS